MGKSLLYRKANFGTMPVFMTAVSTILGAILFLRFGYAVANVGFIGVLAIILIGHLVTIPTALAVAEIATNQKVQGGGAYYIISRSFGLNIGASIGLALFLSQAISVAFYVIAFAEAFDPLIHWMSGHWGFIIPDKRFISVPVIALMGILTITRGANMGMRALYVVVALLFISIFMFLAGKPLNDTVAFNMSERIANPDSFFYVFTIIFPAFTGLAAGLGLSGDLRDPKKSIPAGTIMATVVGVVIYLLVAWKLARSASPAMLAADQMIMQRIALWGPIIPIGLAAASLSSALGSIMVAPRTLQAIGMDQIFPSGRLNRWLGKGVEGSNEPVNGSVITILIALVFVLIGDIDSVAKIISMFFMVTYGAICLISLLEHFSADPSYRPTFRSRWYYSLIGTLASFWLMFQMNLPYAAISLVIMVFFFLFISRYNTHRGLARLFRGVIFQLSRQMQIFAQRANREDRELSWRPFVICISKESFQRRGAFDLLRWISYRYGFGTFIHYIEGYLTQQTHRQSQESLQKLINLAKGSRSRVYLDTIISPSYISAIAQVIQLSGVSGKGNNMILFEFLRTQPESLTDPLKNLSLIRSTNFDVCILNSSYKGFGYNREIHIWITSYDYENANLMILLGYIILGHPEWARGFIKIFALYKENELESKRNDLMELIRTGRLPIAASNIELIPSDPERSNRSIISEYSVDADLTIVGFRKESVKAKGIEVFTGYEDLGNILFVSSNKEKEIK